MKPKTKRRSITTSKTRVTVISAVGQPDRITIRSKPDSIVRMASIPFNAKEQEKYNRRMAAKKLVEEANAKAETEKISREFMDALESVQQRRSP